MTAGDGTDGRCAMPFELQIALRYLLARRKQAFVSVISLVSTLGVAVGVMALILALALMCASLLTLAREVRMALTEYDHFG